MQYLPDRYSNKQYIKRFDEEFRLNLLSIDNLISFIERDKDLLEFRSYLKENNIDTKAYFKNKLIAQNYKKNNIKYIYTLTFSKPLDGEEFFENYVIFTKNVTEDIFKDELYKILINQIKFYNENLLIAKKINSDELYKNSIPPNDRQFLFYKGTQVLSLKIDNLKQFLNYIKEKSLDYDPIVEKASPKQISKSTIILTFLSFISGLIFIIFFIGFKNFLRNKQ